MKKPMPNQLKHLAVYKLPKIVTRNGKIKMVNGMMIPLWKDYDPGRKIKPRYIYYMTCSPGKSKGPYLHTKRRGLLTLIDGQATLVYRIDREFQELSMRAVRNAVMVDIPARVGYLIRNLSKIAAHFIIIGDYPWKKGEKETVTPDFHGYYEQKKR